MPWEPTSSKNFRALSRSNFGSADSMQRKKSVAARQLKTLDVEYRMIRHRQSVERQHPEERRQSSDENRHFKSHRNERRPAVQRPAADVYRIIDDRYPILQKEPAEAADDPADQHDQRHPGSGETRSLRPSRQRETANSASILRNPAAKARRAATSSSSGLSNSAISP